MDIFYLSVKDGVPSNPYWDQTFIYDLLHDLPETDRKVIVIPGAYQWDVIPEINKRLAEFEKIMVFVTSDEECKFNVKALKHPDMIVYSQYGNEGIAFPIGYAPDTHEFLKAQGRKKKDIDWFFAGQVTHYRRKVMIKIAENIGGGTVYKTDGFGKGMEKNVYLEMLNRSKVALCPPGPVSQDSFRLYEALEAGCIPIIDDVSPLMATSNNYLYHLLPGAPFPIFSDFVEFPKLMKSSRNNEYLNDSSFAWWINYKFRLKNMLKSKLGIPLDDTVVVIPVSPIPSHPSTDIIDQTIKSIRHHMDSPILVTIDGVRDEQKDMSESYHEFIKNFLWKCNFEYTNVLPVMFPKHYHQSGMMKEILENISMPYLLYVEQDTPLTEDPIDWKKVKEFIKSGESNCVRFHYEAFIPEPHKRLMIGEPENGFLKTRQWSQRPHLASTAFYRSMMTFFSDKSKCFIEDFIYRVIENGNWDKWRTHIYYPEGNIKRSLNLDGRAGGEKYSGSQIW